MDLLPKLFEEFDDRVGEPNDELREDLQAVWFVLEIRCAFAAATYIFLEHYGCARNSGLHAVDMTGRGEGKHDAAVELVARLIVRFDAAHMDEVHVLEAEEGLIRA